MKKLILILLFWVPAVLAVQAQGWRKTFGEPSISESSNFITRTADDGFLVQSSDDNSSNFVSLYRLDKDGAIIWRFDASPDYIDLGKIVVDTAGNIYVEAHRIGTRRVLKLDSSGNLLTATEIGFYQLAGIQSNGLILWSQPIADTTSIRKYDFDGSLIWDKRMKTTGSTYTLKVGDDGRIYYMTNGTSTTNDLIALDQDGNFIWSYSVDDEKYLSLTIDQQGNLILSGTENGFVPGQNHKFYLLKLSPAAAELWNTTYDIAPYDIVRKDRKSTRLNSSHSTLSRMPSSA